MLFIYQEAMELVVHLSEIGYEYAKMVKMFGVRFH